MKMYNSPTSISAHFATQAIIIFILASCPLEIEPERTRKLFQFFLLSSRLLLNASVVAGSCSEVIDFYQQSIAPITNEHRCPLMFAVRVPMSNKLPVTQRTFASGKENGKNAIDGMCPEANVFSCAGNRA